MNRSGPTPKVTNLNSGNAWVAVHITNGNVNGGFWMAPTKDILLDRIAKDSTQPGNWRAELVRVTRFKSPNQRGA